ncbi:hypothetical protein GG681_10980 [Epibacterium sp. SM1969]|uniref:Uncharacterized protein n=1 Tax=Tritonibacter aquimaris TaxID=2663379 RepID=A0A844AXS4_9RHOB|nr:hypothetical protein [Tritonibacter aquimaris]MQY43164.1 hypothetical protein [Tritonibacter aquimaris]
MKVYLATLKATPNDMLFLTDMSNLLTPCPQRLDTSTQSSKPLKKKGLLGKITQYQTGRIDAKALCADLAKVMKGLEAEGYEIHQVVDVTSGKFEKDTSNIDHRSYGWGYGYSFTEGLIVIAKK